MRFGGAIAALAAALVASGPAVALTMGDVGQEAVSFVSTECSDAFTRHQASWPEGDVERDVVWRNEAILSSTQEIVSDTPALIDHLPRLTAWQMSGYALVDDLTLAAVYVASEPEPSEEWLEGYGELAGTLGAASDVYSCARMTDEAFQNAVNDGAGEGILQTVSTFDCLSDVGRKMADTYTAAAQATAVHAKLVSMLAEIDACERGQ